MAGEKTTGPWSAAAKRGKALDAKARPALACSHN